MSDPGDSSCSLVEQIPAGAGCWTARFTLASRGHRLGEVANGRHRNPCHLQKRRMLLSRKSVLAPVGAILAMVMPTKLGHAAVGRLQHVSQTHQLSCLIRLVQARFSVRPQLCSAPRLPPRSPRSISRPVRDRLGVLNQGTRCRRQGGARTPAVITHP